jgi:hypothetical protein
MRRQSVAWERAAEVREAAEGWRRAGAIGTATYDAVRNAYPDPCVTPSAVWRVLTAGMVTAVVVCTLGALWAATQPGATSLALLLLVLGAAAFMVTEYLEASPRSARRGAAGATAFWGNIFVLGGLAILLNEGLRVDGERIVDAVLLASALVWAASCWRWGSPLFAGLSAVSSFLFLSRLPLGRVLWLLAGAALVGLVARRPDDLAWTPSHRRAAMVLLVVGVGAVYVASNVYSLDEHVIEGFLKFAPPRGARPFWLIVVAAIATAVLPLAILWWALKSRRIVLLDTGIVLLALSLVTLRHYVHIAPLWVVLTASGALLIVVALAVERMLRGRPGGERWGFTADPLFSDERRQQILQTVPVVATFTPPAAPVAAADAPGFTGRGGTFGGGGASDKF